MKTSVRVTAVLLVGLLAGLMFGTGMDQYTHRLLDARGWVTEHQVMDALFRRVLPIWWNATVLILLVATFLSRGSARAFCGVAALLMIVALVVTVRVEVPMNRAIERWNLDAIPANWADVRDHWLRFHLVRTLCGLAAFPFALAGLMKAAPRD
jgi:uncharacterized membrane protein